MKKALILLPSKTLCFLLSIFVLTACLASCGQADNQKENQSLQKQKMQQPEPLKIDTALIAILPLDSFHSWIFEDAKPTTLTNEDLQKIETLLVNCINEYNTNQENKFEEIRKMYPKDKLDKNDYIIDLKNHRRQYIPVMNAKGEKEVWINCFCNTNDPNWKQNIVDVNDGGNCYFNVKINLNTEVYYNLMVNGWA